MSKRIPAIYKAQLGELLADWYRHFGKVAPRRAYHEDDKDGGAGRSSMVFEGHPLLADMPIGAPSDLASVVVADKRTLDEAEKREDELGNELQNKLELTLGKKLQQQHAYKQSIKPQPY